LKILIGGSSSKIFHLKEFANSLEKIGITAKVVLDIDYSDGYPSRKVSKWFKNNNQFKKLINEFKPDFIFVDRQRHFGLSAIKSKIPLIVHLRGDFWKEMKMAEETLYRSFPKKMVLKKWYEIGDDCFKNAKIILPICRHLKKRILEHYPDQNIEVLYQGINPKNWYYEKGIELKHPCIGLVQSANIWEKTKEMLLLTEVMNQFPQITFYWVGDGPYRNEVLPKLEKFENFKWLGSLDYPKKIRQFLSEIDVYALITGIDMSPLTLLEAQLMEKPVIATDVGGIPELMIDGKTGFLIEKNNPKDLEEKIVLILKEIATQKMGSEGKKFVIENFDWEIIAKKFKYILEQYLKNSKN
jgi:glycosyltransferase involved in cell wall biosynthesis